ncbi:FXSXX-COOH protein [Frankia sp. AiPs1]
MPDSEPLIESMLVDLGATGLTELRTHDTAALRQAVSRVIDQLDDADNRFGGYRESCKA